MAKSSRLNLDRHPTSGIDLLSTLDLAVRTAGEAGRLVARAFAQGGWTTSFKSDGTPVTDVDRMVEDWIRSQILTEFPDDAVIGEELPSKPGSSGRRWIIEPIGGTTNFIRGIPYFSTDLAVEDQDGPLLAISAQPMADTMTVACRGIGCRELARGERDFAMGRVLRVNNTHELTGALTHIHGLAKMPLTLVNRLHSRVKMVDGLDSIRNLISGRAEAVIAVGYSDSYEDLAPIPVLVEEAGGAVTDLHGGPVLAGDGTVLATNGQLHHLFLDLLGRHAGSAA